MFGRAFRAIRNFKPLLATSLFALSYGMKKIKFDDIQSNQIDTSL